MQSQKQESPENTPSPQPRSTHLSRQSGSPLSGAPALAAAGVPAAGGTPAAASPALTATTPPPAAEPAAAELSAVATPSPGAANPCKPPVVMDASRPFSRLQRLMQVADAESPASSVASPDCTPTCAPGSAGFQFASPVFVLSPPTSAEGLAPGARPSVSCEAAASGVVLEEEASAQTPAPQMDLAAVSTPEAAPAPTADVPPTPAPPSAIAPVGQPVMTGAFLELVRHDAGRHRRPSGSHSGRFEVASAAPSPWTPAATDSQETPGPAAAAGVADTPCGSGGALLSCPPSASGAGESGSDRLTTACNAAVEWGRRAGVAAAQIDKLRAEVQRFRMEAAHWLREHRQLTVQHRNEARP